VGKEIEQERLKKGNYKELEDFIRRVPVGIEQLIILIRIGAFHFTGKTKQKLLWEAHMFMNKSKPDNSRTLFYSKPRKFTLPELEHSQIENAYDEIEIIGFPVTMNYFALLKTSFRGEILAGDMIRNVGKKVKMVGHLVTIKYVKTVKKEWMHFGTFLDVTGEFFDTVHFPGSLKSYPFKGKGIYLILGVVTEEFDFPSLTVEKLAKLPLMTDPRETS